MGRQSKLAPHKGDPTASFQMDCVNKGGMEGCFAMLKKIHLENKLMNKAAQFEYIM